MGANTPISRRASGTGGFFNVIADRAQEAIAVFDADGVLHYANSSWLKMHGYAHTNEILGKKIAVFHSKEQFAADVLPLLQEIINRGQISGPVGHMHKSGTVVSTNTTMVALKDAAGAVRAIIVYAIDTTEQERLNGEIRNLKVEAEKRMSDLTSTASRLQDRAKELEMVENLLRARGAELESINKQLWQYMSEREQLQEQLQNLRTVLAEKEKEITNLVNQIERQRVEQAKQEHRWKTQYASLTDAIGKLREDIVEMRHQEVEFLDGIDEYPKSVGAKSKLDPEQLKQLSSMAKKFATSG